MKKLFFAGVLAGAVLLSSCGSGSYITKGSESKLDSLSYALGAQIGNGLKFQMRNIPIDYDAVAKGLTEGAFGKGEMTPTEAIELLQDYFMHKRGERMRAIAQKRHEADSIRLVGGDSTKVDYPVADPDMFESEQERYTISYALGLNTGNGLTEAEMPLQTYWICTALKEVQEENPRMDERTAGMYWNNYTSVVIPAQNKEKSEKWLAKIEKKSGVHKTESGLLYKIEKAGDPEVKATDDRDVVKVHYKGTKENGKVFDASRFKDMPKARQEIMKKQLPDNYDEDSPVEFPLNRVIKGWTEGMKLVGKGGKITLWIPSELAYGPRGNRGISGNQALRFDVEVIDVIPYEEPAPVEPADSLAETPAPDAE